MKEINPGDSVREMILRWPFPRLGQSRRVMRVELAWKDGRVMQSYCTLDNGERIHVWNLHKLDGGKRDR